MTFSKGAREGEATPSESKARKVKRLCKATRSDLIKRLFQKGLLSQSEAVPHVVPACHDLLTGPPPGIRALTPLTPNTFVLITSLGALFRRGGPVPDPVLTLRRGPRGRGRRSAARKSRPLPSLLRLGCGFKPPLFWNRNGSRTCLVHTFMLAGTNIGRDGLRRPFPAGILAHKKPYPPRILA